jgi:hypothetical protein
MAKAGGQEVIGSRPVSVAGNPPASANKNSQIASLVLSCDLQRAVNNQKKSLASIST